MSGLSALLLFGLWACGPGPDVDLPSPVVANEWAGGVLDLVPLLSQGEHETLGQSLYDEQKPGLVLGVAGQRDLDVQLPPEAAAFRMSYGLGFPLPANCNAEAQITVGVHALGETPEFTRTTVATDVSDWQHLRVDLSPWKGQSITLRISGEVRGEVETGCAAPILLGEPRLVAGARSAPDLWLVVVDTLRDDRVGRSGELGIRTPHFDALLAESQRFTKARSPSSWTREALFSLFAGAWPATLRRESDFSDTLSEHLPRSGWNLRLSADSPHLAETLRASGYRNLALTTNAAIAPGVGLERGFDSYGVLGADPEVAQRLPTLLRETEDGRPVFVFLHFMTPHLPYRYRAEHTERLLRERGVPGPWPEAIHTRAQVGDEPDERMQAMVGAYYDAEVEFFDQQIGALQELLEDRSSRESWLILTSDHGEELFEHGGFEHGHSLHEEVLRVPLLLRPPDGRRAGSPVEAPVSLLDIAPTFRALAGLPTGVPAFGRSLLTPDLDPSRLLAASGVLYGPPEEALILGNQKHLYDGGQVRAYDLRTDPGEEESRPYSPGDFEAHWRLVHHLDATRQAILAVSAQEELTLSLPAGFRALLLDTGAIELERNEEGLILLPGQPVSLIIEGWSEDSGVLRLGTGRNLVELPPPWQGGAQVVGEGAWEAHWRHPTGFVAIPPSRQEALQALGYVGP